MNGKSILLIDDDADFLRALHQRCEAMGWHVEQTCNLLTATMLVEKRRPDVVCVDVQLPTGNGLAFCESLAADDTTPQLAIVVLTGETSTHVREWCRRLNAHYVAKTGNYWQSLEPVLQRLAATFRPHIGLGRKQIVVADDDDDVVQMVSQRCSSLGCSVIGANNALEAINVIHRAKPDLVCVDVCMPSGSGLSVCEMMAGDDALRQIPVIVLTGRGDESTIRRCHDMMVYYVQKNADTWARLEPLVRELLHLDPATDSLAPPAPRCIPRRSPLTNTAPIARDQNNENVDLVDAVFAVLGVGAATQAKQDDVPWILCIDDDADFTDALRIRLEEHGVAVVRAFNGMEGVRMAFTSPARAILLDFNMPNGQGDYVLGRLKDNSVTKDIPVIIITGVKDKVLERRMLAMGASAFLEKPVNFDSLRHLLARYLDILPARQPLHAS